MTPRRGGEGLFGHSTTQTLSRNVRKLSGVSQFVHLTNYVRAGSAMDWGVAASCTLSTYMKPSLSPHGATDPAFNYVAV